MTQPKARRSAVYCVHVNGERADPNNFGYTTYSTAHAAAQRLFTSLAQKLKTRAVEVRVCDIPGSAITVFRKQQVESLGHAYYVRRAIQQRRSTQNRDDK